MQGKIEHWFGIAIRGEILISIGNRNYVHANISDGITQEMLDIINLGLANKEECIAVYEPIWNEDQKRFLNKPISIWVGEKNIFGSEKPKTNENTQPEHEEDER